MPAKSHTPSYRRHASGRATVRLNGRDIYLGTYGTDESRRNYDRVIAEWLARGRRLAIDPAELTVVELIAAFWEHALSYYRHPDGTLTGEHHCFNLALLPLKELYAESLVQDFGPLKLRAVRNRMIDLGWSRTTINAAVNRTRRVFKWGVGQQLVQSNVWEALRAVEPLLAGRCAAPEPEAVKPVPLAWVNAVLPCVSRQVAAMIRLQSLTGMRPGEVVRLRGIDIEAGGKIWLYKPTQHKTRHHGQTREIHIGPRAQEVLRPFLKENVEAWCFSPAEADADSRAARHARRKTPIGQGNEQGTNRRHKPTRKPGERYTTESYRRAIARGCEIAFGMPADLLEPRTKKTRNAEAELAPEIQKQRREARRQVREKWREQHVWHPNQLRHSFGTEVRKAHGLDAAQVLLGHQHADVTQVYAEADRLRAQGIIAEIG